MVARYILFLYEMSREDVVFRSKRIESVGSIKYSVREIETRINLVNRA